MKIRILCLDDNLQTLSQPLQSIFGTMLIDGSIPGLVGGASAPFDINGFGETSLRIEIVSNSQNDPAKVCKEVDVLSKGQRFDIVLVDDDWGKFGNTAGQSHILPKAISSITGISSELPVFVLFTQHWEQTDRVRAFCDLMARYPEEQQRVTGLHKNDTSGLMLLIQRVVTERRIVEDCERLAEENRRLHQQLEMTCPRPENTIGESDAMRHVYSLIRSVAPTSAPVLILGESGVGKELVAEAIHAGSDRKSREMIRVNCAAITDSLSESELFGHEKGAFTGANERRAGWFETATDTSVFFDEIGDLNISIQAKLLRVLQHGTFSRVGGNAVISTQARIIAATNKQLRALVDESKFREDLYYRISIFPIEVPPLRHRQKDISLLVEHFVRKKASACNKSCERVSRKAMERLTGYSWPGNVRELENVIHRAVILCEGEEIRVEHLPPLESKSGGLTSQLVYPIDFDKFRADFSTVARYLMGCLNVVSNNSQKTKWTLREVEKELGSKDAFKAYLNENPGAVALVVRENMQLLRPILSILRKCDKVRDALIDSGIT